MIKTRGNTMKNVSIEPEVNPRVTGFSQTQEELDKEKEINRKMG